MNHNLHVLRVYSAVQFKPNPVFAGLGRDIQEIRREADRNPGKGLEPKANMAKLQGNSSYGK